MSFDPAVAWQHCIPQRLVCRFIYHTARSTRPWFARPLMRWFATRYGLDLTEAEKTSIDDYDSLNALFTRALKPGARQIDTTPGVIVAPADGMLTQAGTIERGRLVQAKGIDYSLADLLGEADTTAFDGGTTATIYLAPHNYHRVHTPLAGRLKQTRFIPGARYSVNGRTAASVRGLFCRNERAVFEFECDGFSYYLVMVGALNVASISTVTLGELPSGSAACHTESPARPFDKGEEVGRFNLGSTAIVVFPNACRVQWHGAIGAVQLGQRIATLPASNA